MKKSWCIGIGACLMWLCLLLPAAAAEGGALELPESGQLVSGRLGVPDGSTVWFEVDKQEDLGQMLSALAGVNDLEPLPSGPQMPLNEEFYFELDTKAGKTYRYVLSGNQITAEQGEAQGTVSQKLGPLKELAARIQRDYQPEVPPFQLGIPGAQESGKDVLWIDRLHLYENGTKTFVPLEQGKLEQAVKLFQELNGQRVATEADLGEPLLCPDEVAVYAGETKLLYTLYESGIRVDTEAFRYVVRDGKFVRQKWEIPPQFYRCDREGYAAFCTLVKECYQQGEKGAYWLGMMREKRLQNTVGEPALRFLTDSLKETPCYDPHIEMALEDLRAIQVKPESMTKVAPSVRIADPSVAVRIYFENDIVYTVTMNERRIVVSSSDMPYAVWYEIEEDSPRPDWLLSMAVGEAEYTDVRPNPST